VAATSSPCARVATSPPGSTSPSTSSAAPSAPAAHSQTPVLDAFIADFAHRHHLTLDWIYEARMLFGLIDLARHAAFPTDTRIVAVIAG
jgi:hypothetical protein